MKFSISISCIYLLLSLISCKKYLEVGVAATDLTNASLFKNDATATAAQLAIYSQMENELFSYHLIQYTGTSSDELINYSPVTDNIDMAENNLLSTNSQSYSFWTSLYKYIYEANAVLEGLDRSTALSKNVRQQLRGEAIFIRAYCYYYLASLYGDVPMVTTTDYLINATMGRTPFRDVLNAIRMDLTEAADLLSMEYMNSTNEPITERVRPNRAAANAILARVRLWQGDWPGAEAAAADVIGSSVYVIEPDLADAFLKESREAIWQLESPGKGFNSFSGYYLILKHTPNEISLQPRLLGSFDPGDRRAENWIGRLTQNGHTYLFPYKYKAGYTGTEPAEYTVLLRLTEQYLIRAEARAWQANLAGALEDLNMVRLRASLSAYTDLTRTELLDHIVRERQWELFAEGDRWIDLRRANKANTIMPIVKGASWTSNDQLYPIPQHEIIRNHNLTQNPGY